MTGGTVTFFPSFLNFLAFPIPKLTYSSVPMITLALALLLAAPAAEPSLDSVVHQVKLNNGMTWLLVRREAAPVFSAYWRVRAGGVDEHPGITGLAHLFEHMAFKGTAQIGTRDFAAEAPLLAHVTEVGDALSRERAKGDKAAPNELARLEKSLAEAQAAEAKFIVKDELSDLYQRNGAVGLNATTDKDLTSYFVSFPKNRLQLWARTEAARFSAPVLREFYSERDVVTQERRMRVDASPVGRLNEQLTLTAFSLSPQRWPGVGTLADLATLKSSDALEFYQKYYTPANAVGAIVGDIDLEATTRLLESTFGAVPEGPVPAPPRDERWDRAQDGERRVRVEFDAEPIVEVAWHKPTLPARDDYVFDALEILLTEGPTSRLYRSLVLEKRLVQGVGTFQTGGGRLDNLFTVAAAPLKPHTSADVLAAIDTEVEKLQQKPVDARELQRVLNHLEVNLAREVASNEGLASALSYYEALAGDWHYLTEHRKVLQTITPADVQRAAQTYLVRNNRTVAELVRPAKTEGAR